MSGWRNQEAGDWGEAVVRLVLSRSRITSASLAPDLGEDFLIEVGGREASATGSHPRIALIQVKACVNECHENEIKVPGIKKTKLMRWSAQQLPVFIVAVSGYCSKKEQFFLQSIDTFLEKSFPGIEVRDIRTESVTVTAYRTDDLAAALIDGVETFHRRVEADLRGLSEEEKRNDHFEVMKRGHPSQFEKLIHCSWKIIWKAPRRPTYFAAMVNDLFMQARNTYRELNVPVYVSFHVYRSQYDMDHNMAVARVHWIDESHPGAEIAVKATGHPNPRIEYVETHRETRAFIDSKTADAPEFLEVIRVIGPTIDKFAERLLIAEFLDKDGIGFWTDAVGAEMDALDAKWQSSPYAPTELRVLEGIVDDYIYALSCHRIFSGKAPWRRDGCHDRYRNETAQEIRYYYGSWWVVMKKLGHEMRYYS